LRLIWRVAAVGYVAAIVLASLWPAGVAEVYDPLAEVSWQSQKVGHVAVYAGLVPVLAVAFFRRLDLRRILWLAAACCAFGGVLELVQLAVPGRIGSWRDFLLNAAGVAIGAACTDAWRRLRAKVQARPVPTDHPGSRSR
jgi:VanZ family protein